MAFDAERWRNVLPIDIDHPDALERAGMVAALGLPPPTLMIDPWSGYAHGVMRLARPVYTGDGARPEPMRLFGYAGALVASAMGATLLPRRALLKSPWGRQANLIGTLRRRGPVPGAPLLWEAHRAADNGLLWHTVPAGELRPVQLREIILALADEHGEAAATPPARHWCRRHVDPDARGRNCGLFDLVRHWSYARIERDAGAIHAYAERANRETFGDRPLPDREVAAVARSIARFMANRYRPPSTREPRRDDIGGAGFPPEAKRILSGVRTAADRAERTDAAIAEARDKLLAEGKPVKQIAVAAAAGTSRWSMSRRRLQAEQPRPWEAAGVSRATWYRRRTD